MENSNKSNKTSIISIAKQYNRHRRDCVKCSFYNYSNNYRVGSDLEQIVCNTVCANSFVKGFKKGYKYYETNRT